MGLHPFPASSTRQHLGHARAAGLDRIVLSAAQSAGVRGDVLLAIASRESHIGQMPPLRADWTGDGGRGRGLMQIDDRWHPEFVRAHRNDDHAANARYAARLLADNLRAFDGDYIAAVAAYNSGPGNVRKALRRDLPAEHYTTGRDYATDVLARARVISAALGGTASPTTPASTVDWGTVLGVAGAATLLIAPSLAGAGLLMVGLVAKAQSEGLLP